MNRIARRAKAVVLLIVLLLGGLGFFCYEYFHYGNDWVMKPGNPHVFHGENMNCGTVVDRHSVLLLDLDGGRVYSTDQKVRMSTLHWLGDRYGYIHAPVVPHYSNEMVGYDPLTGLYSFSGQGQATLTLSSKVQSVALGAMGEHRGTVAVYNYKTGEILCAVTTPTYDPDDIHDETPEGLYMNRFLQSVYIPGSVFKIVTTAAALEYAPQLLQQRYTCTGKVEYGPDSVTCEKVHGDLSFADAMAQSCNCAYAKIVESIGQENLSAFVERSGVTESVSFDGAVSAKGNFESSTAIVELAWSGIGQHKDQINPASFLAFLGAIANGGQGAKPYLVSQVSSGKKVTYRAQTQLEEAIVSQKTARQLSELMNNNVEVKYGAENFPGLTVCAKSGTGQVGGGQKSNALFAGFVQDEQYPLAFIAVVEEGGYGRAACVPIISKVLAACKETMDAAS